LVRKLKTREMVPKARKPYWNTVEAEYRSDTRPQKRRKDANVRE
jgi:hypothetical protein